MCIGAEYYGHRGLALGLAKYVPTGRDLATKRVSFVNTFLRYSYSHIGPALDMLVLLLVTLRYNALGLKFYLSTTQSLWIVAGSWLIAPAVFNPSAFSLGEVQKDYAEWTAWLRSTAFEDFFFGQKAGARSTGDLAQNNWFSWLNVRARPAHLAHAANALPNEAPF